MKMLLMCRIHCKFFDDGNCLLTESDGGFGQELYNRIRVALSLLIVLTRHCLVGGMSGLQSLIHNRLVGLTYYLIQ